MFMSKTENLIIIMLISILLIPVYPSTYSSHPVFLLSLNLQQHIFFIFFLTGAKDMGNYIFFPVPSPPPSSIASNPPFCFACHCPLCAYYFFNIIAIFYRNSQWEPLQRREHQKPTILHYLMLQKKKH